MTSIRAPLSSVLSTLRTELEEEAREAAGSNTVISRSEQARLKDSITRTTADEIRAAGGAGTTVNVDTLVEAAAQKMSSLLGSVNQATGAGAATVSQAEVRALAAAHPDAGVRVARAYELITGKRISLDGVAPVTPVDPTAPPASVTLGDLNEVHPVAFAFVKQHLDDHAGGNGALNAAERASLPSGFIKDAAYATPPPRGSYNVTVFLFNQLDLILTECGVEMVKLGQLDASGSKLVELPFSQDALVKLVARHAEAAGLFADAIAATTGTRPDVPGLPPARFSSPTPAPPPRVPTFGSGDVVHDIPGAAGAVSFLDPARVDALMQQLEVLVPMMDLSRNGTVTLAEAVSFAKRASIGAFPDDPANLDPLLRALYFAREAVYQRTHAAPSVTAIVDEVKTVAARAKEIGLDESGAPFDRAGPVDGAVEIAALALHDFALSGGRPKRAGGAPVMLDLDDEPWVRFFDHEGDVAPTKRTALDTSGPADAAIRKLVFHYNKAENDNHWPLWSGRATSRYRLDADETDQVVGYIRAQPAARKAELFQAMVDWLSWPSTPGLLYVDVDARHQVDALAIELGHPYRSPAGDTRAPVMPGP